MGAVLILAYAVLIVFVGSVAARFIKISRLPIHLRWELYPVAHEGKKARYGGSYLEEPDWWSKPREKSLAGELRVMIPEILLLEGIREHNRSQWIRTFPFHFGLYLLAGLIALLLIGGIASLAGMTVSAGGGLVGKVLYHLTWVVGYAGLVLALAGSIALLGRRIFNLDYREYTKKGDYFNLAFFILVLLVSLGAHLSGDRDFSGLRAFFAQLLSFDLAGEASWQTGPGVAEIVLASLLFAYIPLTHMSHFFTKWFMYHDIRWSDEPNLRGGKIERQVQEALQYPVSWSAPHIAGDGKKTWVDVATSDVEEPKK